MCFGCSKELSHWDCSSEYPLHMFWLRNKKNNFPVRTLIWGPGQILYPRSRQTKQKIECKMMNIFLSISFNICFGSLWTVSLRQVFWLPITYGPRCQKICLCGFANNTGTDQSGHPRRLISAFVIRLSKKYHIWTCYKRNFNFPASLWSWRDWFETRFVGNPEDRFSRDEAHMFELRNKVNFFIIHSYLKKFYIYRGSYIHDHFIWNFLNEPCWV